MELTELAVLRAPIESAPGRPLWPTRGLVTRPGRVCCRSFPGLSRPRQ